MDSKVIDRKLGSSCALQKFVDNTTPKKKKSYLYEIFNIGGPFGSHNVGQLKKNKNSYFFI